MQYELYIINALAPFHMNQEFKELLKNANGSYIINVSSVEGMFNVKNKSQSHPQTNMAKAALNMMTRTVSGQYKNYNIYMVSVDTGWVTNEFPHEYKHNDFTNDTAVPLTCIDGACRILDPIFNYYNGSDPVYGVILKDYKIVDW